MTDDPKQSKQRNSAPSEAGDDPDQAQNLVSKERQDAFVVLSLDKDVRNAETVRIKASAYTGIAVRMKTITQAGMEAIVKGIDLDVRRSQEEDDDPDTNKLSLINLRFEEVFFSKKVAGEFADFMRHKHHLESIGFISCKFEDTADFRRIMENIRTNKRVNKLLFQNTNFDEEIYGKSIANTLIENLLIREFDMSYCEFEHPKCLYDISMAVLNERCRLNVLKLRGLKIKQFEAKILQLILMRNKQLTTLDISTCKEVEEEAFMTFLQKFNEMCNIRYLTMEGLQPDPSRVVEDLGETLAKNNRLEVLIMKENKIKWTSYQKFWSSMIPNKTIQKLNLNKTDLSDRVIEKMGLYLEQQDISLLDLDLSRNFISDEGIKVLSKSLMVNKTLKYLNLRHNRIREDGYKIFSEYLSENKTLEELSLSENAISNEGIKHLSTFLPHNRTLKMLEMVKCQLTDQGFGEFGKAMADNKGIQSLDISRNKEISDDGSLISLVNSLTKNQSLKKIILNGLHIRKPFCKQYFEPALMENISLQIVEGKIPVNIIDHELKLNRTIEKEILHLFKTKHRVSKNQFNLSLVEDKDNHSFLNIRDQPNKLIAAAFKLIKYKDVRMVDFSNTKFHDENMRTLASYLASDTNLRSIYLDQNAFTDDGIKRITEELKINTSLAHLSMKNCTNVSEVGLNMLKDVISFQNTVLFQIDLDTETFDEELANTIMQESSLNRDIQERLKPQKIVSMLNDKKKKNAMQMNAQSTEQTERQMYDLRVAEKRMSDSRLFQISRSVNVSSVSALHDLSSKHIEPFQDKTFSVMEDATQRTHHGPKKSRPNSARSQNQATSRQDSYEPSIRDANSQNDRLLEEVQFAYKAPVAECFKSALKCWRIYEPNVINLENLEITDQHIEELCAFLDGRNMVQRLNLRRNHIGNKGAIKLSNFIRTGDQTLTHIDLERNYIGDDGGHELLKSLSFNYRIIQCKLKYGNPISENLAGCFDREIVANTQAVAYEKDNKELEERKRVQMVDKGPEHMRCAVKISELRNIVHLSLPDNMLGLEESRMLSQLIIKNTPLKKLDLSQNSLDAECAALLANALIYNSNLKILNVSQNTLGDLGVYVLFTPLIRKQLHEQKITPHWTPVITERQQKLENKFIGEKRVIKDQSIQQNLQIVNIESNMATEEMYKHVWLAQILNPALTIYVDEPSALPRQQELQENNDQAKVIQEIWDLEQQDSSSFDSDWEEKQRKRQQKAEAAKKRREQIRNCQKKIINCFRKTTCFNDYRKEFQNPEKIPSVKQVCCWRLLRARYRASLYHTSEDALETLERSRCQTFIAGLISFNYLALYFVIIIPFVMIIIEVNKRLNEEERFDECIEAKQEEECEPIQAYKKLSALQFNYEMAVINLSVLVYSLACELILILTQIKSAKLRFCNQYLLGQILNGVTLRAMILISAQLVAVFIQEVNGATYFMAFILGGSLILSQVRAIQIYLVAHKLDYNCLLPQIERNYKLSMSTYFLGLAVIYKKISTQPSQTSLDAFTAQRKEREKMMSYSGYEVEVVKKQKCASLKQCTKQKLTCKICRPSSPKFWQLVHNDLPLLMAIPVAWIYDLIDPYTALGAFFITLVDTLSMLTYLCHDDDSGVASQHVYELVEARKRENYASVRAIDSEAASVADMESLDHSRSRADSNELRVVPQVEIIKEDEKETKLDDLGFYPGLGAVQSKDDSKLYNTVVQLASPRNNYPNLYKGKLNVNTGGQGQKMKDMNL